MTVPIEPVGKPGFQPKRKIYVLDFTDTELDGLVVRARSSDLAGFMKLGEFADLVEDAADVAAEMRALNGLLELFDQVLVEWNLLDDNGEDVPPTAAGLATLDPPQVMVIIGAWQHAVAAVAAPLPNASTPGSPSLVGSMPMEPLSESRAS